MTLMHEFASLTPDSRLAELLADYPGTLFSPTLYRSIELVERYSLDLAIAIIDRLGVATELEDWRSAAGICRRLNFDPLFQRPLAWLLERLAFAHLLATRQEEGGCCYRRANSWYRPELERLRDIGLAIDPANAATLDLLDAAAAAYPAVARGGSGEEALLGSGNMALWLAYFHNANPLYAVNNWVSAIAAARRLVEKSRLRILEVGAGAGSGTEALLRTLNERCPDCRIERYLVTEPSPFLRRRAERLLTAEYRALPLKFAPLDMNQSWTDQGVAGGSFDLIYAVNTLHVAADLPFSLRQMQASLAEDGCLVVGECLRPFPEQPVYIELVFQLLASFTRVTTDPIRRPNPGFLTAEQWRRLLLEAGFNPVEVTPDQERIREIYPRLFVGAVCGRKQG
ncbi:MAG: class I SAM-dependent methyltransferase [Candidatus Competibacteraceae bacterium]